MYKKNFYKWVVLWIGGLIIVIIWGYNSLLEQQFKKRPFDLKTDLFDLNNKLNNGDTLEVIANVSVCTTFRVEKDVITKEKGRVYIQSEAAGFIIDEWREVLPKRKYQYNLSDSLNYEDLFRYVANLGTGYNSIYSNTFKIIYKGDTVRYYSNGLGEQIPNSEYYLSIKRRLYPKQKIYEPLEDVHLPPLLPSNLNSISEQIVYDSHKSDDFLGKFLMLFSADSFFQIKHIRFPFKLQSFDIEDNVETSLVMPEQWKHLDLNYDSAYAKRDFDAYERKVQEFKDSSVVSLRGIDNGIGMDYIFKRIEDDWMLTMLIDYSN